MFRNISTHIIGTVIPLVFWEIERSYPLEIILFGRRGEVLIWVDGDFQGGPLI
jgi:hypothetical protein